MNYGDYGRRRAKARERAAAKNRRGRYMDLLEESKKIGLVEEARDWIKDCVNGYSENPDDVDDLSDLEVVKTTNSHYDGGWKQFRKDSGAVV